MEVVATYNKKRLNAKKYFSQLIENIEYVPQSVLTMLRLSRSNLEIFTDIQKRLVAAIKSNKIIKDRVQRLLSIQG